MLELLVTLVLILLVAIIFLVSRFYAKIEKISIDQETLKGAVVTCWRELGIDQDMVP